MVAAVAVGAAGCIAIVVVVDCRRDVVVELEDVAVGMLRFEMDVGAGVYIVVEVVVVCKVGQSVALDLAYFEVVVEDREEVEVVAALIETSHDCVSSIVHTAARVSSFHLLLQTLVQVSKGEAVDLYRHSLV